MRKNNEVLINELLIQNYEKYYRIAFGYVHNGTDAMDIVQEGAYKAIYHSDKLKKQEYADTWICRIMINEAMEFFRKQNVDYADMEVLDVGREEEYEDVDLQKAIDRLSPEEKKVVLLRYFEDMSLNQVAEIAGENLNTVKSRLYRALDKLKLSLGDA
ncbi:MAG: sigma-70 family RNA polymerase sigma factor [Thermoflexaceae bacterium]|nr:sigma-70 family RNA polymerase sigma factor [Thermoflexaceae bacterium]